MSGAPSPEVLAAPRVGRTLDAIGMPRETAGLDLAPAGQAVERVAQPGRRGVAAGDVPVDARPPVAAPAAPRVGRRIEATRLVRGSSGLGLEGSGQAVERCARGHAAGPVGHGGPVRAGGVPVFAGVAGAIAAAVAAVPLPG